MRLWRTAETFVNYHQAQSWYQPSGDKPAGWEDRYNYVIICEEDLAYAIDSSDFVAWKESLDYDVVIVQIANPMIANAGGRDLPENIRNFLREHYGPWGIEYLLLLGDVASVPMRYCYPDPWNHSFHPDDPFEWGGEVPSDYYYADLSRPDYLSWDSDGDGYPGEFQQDHPDFFAEISVGRIPSDDYSEIFYALNKIMEFEQDNGAWKKQSLHAGSILFHRNQDHSGVPLVDGATIACYVQKDIMTDWSISRLCEYDGLAPSPFKPKPIVISESSLISDPINPWTSLTYDYFIDNWRNGQYSVVIWAGHGSAMGAVRSVWFWDDGDNVPETHEITQPWIIHNDTFLEDDYSSIVFAISCLVGYPEANYYGRLGVEMLVEHRIGASIGVLSATRGSAVSAEWPSSPGGAGFYYYEFHRYMINGNGETQSVGDALYTAKHFCHTNYDWDDWY
ncbi:MAG: hypothetical protein GF315_09465, partial [candidate division Zixibacteria bacterium]|nr:hypothetical protein [candidate division Zixibacteria bacterium]